MDDKVMAQSGPASAAVPDRQGSPPATQGLLRRNKMPGPTTTLRIAPFLQAAPLAAVLIVFLLLPMVVLLVVSFFDYDSVQIIPAFQFTNYFDVLGSAVTWRTYANTLRYTVIVWSITVVLGFTVAYVLAFEIRDKTTQMVLFLVCTVPFLTSNIIRMISWIPFLGREGLLNSTLLRLGLIHQPLEFCYSLTSPSSWPTPISTFCSW